MKTFAGCKDSEQILAQCAADGIAVDSAKYEAGGDHLVVELPGPTGEKVRVLYNVVSGRFFYSANDGSGFSSDDNRDGQPWFDAMLDFFYVEAVAA